MSKVLGVGMIKTGITSLGKSLEILGYETEDYRKSNHIISYLNNIIKPLDRFVKRNEYFKDLPYLLMYERIYKLYPDTKFILTLRENENDWYESLCNQANTYNAPELYIEAIGIGFPQKHKEGSIKGYKEHNEKVLDFFKDKPDSLLTVCWEKGDGWKEICNFLEKDEPNVPFPHLNKRKEVKLYGKS